MTNIVKRCFEKFRNHYAWKEHKKKFGDLNPDVTFYVIRRKPPRVGMNSHFIVNLGQVRYAVKRGWIPVIDMQNYPNVYLEPEELGRINAWDYYFNQPCKPQYSLEEVYKSKNVVLSSWEIPKLRPDDTMEFFTRMDIIEMWHRYFVKYIGFSEALLKEVDKMYEKYFKNIDGGRILGVCLRGTDYFVNKPSGHPVQPSISEALDVTRKVIKEQNCEWIYLATEDIHILEAFLEEFGEKVIYYKEAKRYDMTSSGEPITTYAFDSNRKNDKYIRGMEYMVSMVLLTKCNCFIGGRTSGNVAVMVWQPHYDYTYFWNLGRFGFDDVIDEV